MLLIFQVQVLFQGHWIDPTYSAPTFQKQQEEMDTISSGRRTDFLAIRILTRPTRSSPSNSFGNQCRECFQFSGCNKRLLNLSEPSTPQRPLRYCTVMQIVSSRMHFLRCLSCNIFLNLDELGKSLDMVYNVSEFSLS